MSAPAFLGLRCPQCGQRDQIDILAEVWVRVTADGTDADASHVGGEHDFNSDSTAECCACNHSGVVSEFESEGADAES